MGSLHTLVPEGSTLVVGSRPAALWDDPATGGVLRALFEDRQLEIYRARTGVDPRALDELWIAEHPGGRVILARGPIDASFAVREAGERMAPLESASEDPFVRRAGFLSSNRRSEVAALDDETLVWVEGSPQLTAAVLAAAARHERRRDHALGARALASAWAARREAPFVLVVPLPLGLPRDSAIGLLLARQQTLIGSISADEDGALRIELELGGEFPDGATENFRSLAQSLADSELGLTFGARDAWPSLRIEAEDTRVSLSADFDPVLVARGLRVLFVAELAEILELDLPAGSHERLRPGSPSPARGGGVGWGEGARPAR